GSRRAGTCLHQAHRATPRRCSRAARRRQDLQTPGLDGLDGAAPALALPSTANGRLDILSLDATVFAHAHGLRVRLPPGCEAAKNSRKT
ncbi:MAG: hypothetical protein KGJ30_11245, partial [Burkholderiales bacterium]|nr:hypothetical protein [Burkholderiales bacterium]